MVLHYLGKVCFQEELEVLGHHALGDGVDVVQRVLRSFEREKGDQTHNLQNKVVIEYNLLIMLHICMYDKSTLLKSY